MALIFYSLARLWQHCQSMNPEIIGWASSTLLLFTMGRQIWKQWQEGSSEGVSAGLFIGQIAASFGFLIYSWMVRNWVFVATNAVMVLSAIVGYCITVHHRRRAKSKDA